MRDLIIFQMQVMFPGPITDLSRTYLLLKNVLKEESGQVKRVDKFVLKIGPRAAEFTHTDLIAMKCLFTVGLVLASRPLTSTHSIVLNSRPLYSDWIRKRLT